MTMTAEGPGLIPMAVELQAIVAVDNGAVAMGEEAGGFEEKGKNHVCGEGKQDVVLLGA